MFATWISRGKVATWYSRRWLTNNLIFCDVFFTWESGDVFFTSLDALYIQRFSLSPRHFTSFNYFLPLPNIKPFFSQILFFFISNPNLKPFISIQIFFTNFFLAWTKGNWYYLFFITSICIKNIFCFSFWF